MIYVKVKRGEYEGWMGVLNGVIQQGKNPADTIVSVSIAPPPVFGVGFLTEVYLPQGWLTRMQ